MVPTLAFWKVRAACSYASSRQWLSFWHCLHSGDTWRSSWVSSWMTTSWQVFPSGDVCDLGGLISDTFLAVRAVGMWEDGLKLIVCWGQAVGNILHHFFRGDRKWACQSMSTYIVLTKRGYPLRPKRRSGSAKDTHFYWTLLRRRNLWRFSSAWESGGSQLSIGFEIDCSEMNRVSDLRRLDG